jgi:hypothetical protein
MARTSLFACFVALITTLAAFLAASPADATADRPQRWTSRTVVARSVTAPASNTARRPISRSTPACRPGIQRTSSLCTDTDVPGLSEGGCGFLQRCIYLTRAEQAAIVGGSTFLITALLCVEVGPLCVVAGTIVATVAAYIIFQRSGAICPAAKPKLKVRWFPGIAVLGCVD